MREKHPSGTRIVPFRRVAPRLRVRSRIWRPASAILPWLMIGAAALWLAIAGNGSPMRLPRIGDAASPAPPSFAVCRGFRRGDCVIDGDTFRMRGQTIRIMDIDAPETHPARCDEEERLGTLATLRLRDLLNDGDFRVRTSGRDRDQYGRQLRVVERGGRSLGAILVAEGLARPWTGHRRPWCR